jgi:hypothetical protein
MVMIPLDGARTAYGLVTDIHIDDDGLVRQLVTAGEVSEAVIRDNRQNRNVPVEMSVLFVGCKQGQDISHLLPPRPPLSLDSMFACAPEDICAFTDAGRLGYLRHILEMQEIPTADLLAAHMLQAARARRADQDLWLERAINWIVTQLRDDYPRLMTVMQALADVRTELSR